MNLIFGIASSSFIIMILLIRNHESKNRKNNEFSNEKIIQKKHWCSIWIDGTLHKQMMTLEFRETYFIIYQTFSSRTVLYISYKEIFKADQLDVFKRSKYIFKTENKPRIIKLKQTEANVLDLIKAKQDIK